MSTWSRALDLADRTPPSRSRYVDFLRALSIAAVIFGHWLIAAPWVRAGELHLDPMLAVQPWTQWLTLLFQVMPVFFLVGGYSNAASWESAQRSGTPYGTWVAGRARRLPGAACVCAVLLAAAANLAAAEPADTIRQYQFEPDSGRYRLALKEVPRPVAGAGQVLVRVRATSLNRRDVNILNAESDTDDGTAGGVPLSDGAGEVIAVGPGVSRFRVGDRVAGIFFERWLRGAPTLDMLELARGGNSSGMLSEVVVSHENGLVAIPAHLTYEEAATLPCAAVTAWVGLFKRGRLQPGQFVLLEGTGGVSVFGLIFAAAAGAKPIITSSQDDKLERAVTLGAFGTVNYRSHPDWQLEVRRLTAGAGVDQVLDVGGRETLGKALEALAPGGHVALIGGLSGYGSDLPTDSLMWINATASGVYVGSREDFEAMNAFISKHQLRPLVDQVFEFERAQEAFDAMQDGRFMGKIVIRL